MKRFLAMVLVCLMFFSGTSAFAEWLYATDGDTYIHYEADVDSRSLGTFKKGEKIWVFEHVYTPDGRNWCGVNYLGKTAFISDRYSSYQVSNPDDYVDVNEHNSYRNEYRYYDKREYDTYDSYDDYEEDEDDDDDFIYNRDYYHDEFEFEEEFQFEVIHNTKARALPNRESQSLGKIAVGTMVYASRIYTSEDGKAWLEVQGDNGSIGYVSTGHVKLTQGLINNHFPILSRFMYVTGGRVNVREDANINSMDIGTIHEGDIIIVDYYICVYDDDRRIWAHAYDEHGNYLGFVSTLYLTANEG